MASINTGMPRISRDKDLAVTGHGCSAVAPCIATATSVFINGIRVARPPDPLVPHTLPVGPFCLFHFATINSGSFSVFAQGIPVARVGDSADFGAVIQGSNNVFAG